MMPRTYFPADEVEDAIREAVSVAREQGFRQGVDAAKNILSESSRLNGAAHVALKALEVGDGLGNRGGIDPIRDRGSMADYPGGDSLSQDLEGVAEAEPVPHEALTLAIIDALSEAKIHHPDSDGGEVVKYLESLLDDPEALAAALVENDANSPTNNADHANLHDAQEVVQKAFDEGKHPRGDDGRFISRESIHEAKSDPEKAAKLRERVTDPEERKKLDAALGGEVDLGRTKAGLHREKVAQSKAQKAEAVQKARELANDISTARRGGEPVTSEHYKELAKYLPHLTVQELRSVRGKLAASFGGSRRRDEMVAKLLEHAKNKALLEETNEKYTDLDPLDFGALSEYQSEGNAKGPGENPNPDYQHGGRMEQRHTLMQELPEGAKTSHGTPDMGSVLKEEGRVFGDKPGIGRDRTAPDPSEARERTAQDEYRDEVAAGAKQKEAPRYIQQWQKIKEQYPGKMVFIKNGDHFDTMGEDAATAAKITKTTSTGSKDWPMVGFPKDKWDAYKNQLKDAGVEVVVHETPKEVPTPIPSSPQTQGNKGNTPPEAAAAQNAPQKGGAAKRGRKPKQPLSKADIDAMVKSNNERLLKDKAERESQPGYRKPDDSRADMDRM